MLGVVEEEVVVQVQCEGSEGWVDTGVGGDGRRNQHHSVHTFGILNLVKGEKNNWQGWLR